MIIYTGQTFSIVIVTGFRTKLYMQHLRSLLCFLVTILNTLSLTTFPLISVGSQISVAPPSYKRLTSKCRSYQKPVHYLIVTKIKCIYIYIYIYIYNIYIEAVQIISLVALEYIKLIYIIMIVTYGYLFSNFI